MLFSGTAIIAIRTKDELLLAVDSKVIGVAATVKQEASISKITQFGHMFVASAGIFRDLHGTFNVVETIRSIKGSRLHDTVRRFEDAIKEPLGEAVSWIRQANPAYYVQQMQDRFALSIVFMGFERSQPLLFTRHFRCTEQDNAIHFSI